MFVVKNAWKSVTRNKGRNMLIIVIVTIIAAAATIGLSIRQAAATARSSGLDNTTVTAQISLDRGKLISSDHVQLGAFGSGAFPALEQIKIVLVIQEGLNGFV